MKIGILIHTKFGSVALVARKLAVTFTQRGDTVDTHLLRTEGKVAPHSTAFEITSSPSIDGCDLLIFGAPVWAFGASPVIIKFVDQLRGSGKLSGKKTICFVTKGLPFGWTGGKQALNAMQTNLTGAGAKVLAAEIFFVAKLKNEKSNQPAIDRIVAAASF